MNFMSLDEKSYQIPPATEIKEFPNMSEEDQLEMNAKIRRRINHKKIIALYKNRWFISIYLYSLFLPMPFTIPLFKFEFILNTQ